MHNTQIYSHSFYAVVGIVFAASLTCFALLTFVQFHLYLFIGGIPSFSRGGNLTNGEQCFDLYDCAMKLCTYNGTLYTPNEMSCNDTVDDYIQRLPAWMIPEYKKFEIIFWRSVVMIATTSINYFLFPIICYFLWKMAYSPFIIRNVSRVFDVILAIFSLASCFVAKSSLDQLNVFRPNLVWWMNDVIDISSKLLLVVLFGQVIIIFGGLVYNNYIQKHSDIISFDPLIPDDDDTMTWRKGE